MDKDGELVIVNKPENIERDIVTTPNVIVREILHQTATEMIIGKNDSQINALKCADIACGSGAFLLELYQFLSDALIDYYQSHCPSVLIQTSINTYKLPFGIKRNLLVNCIYGVDKDFNAVEACKFSILLKLLEMKTLIHYLHSTPSCLILMKIFLRKQFAFSRECSIRIGRRD